MAATYILTSPRFPNGTIVAANPRSGRAEPVTAEVAGGSATFTGLLELEEYVAHATVGGVYVNDSFTTDGGSAEATGVVSFELVQDPVTGYASRPEGAVCGTWTGWTDPTELMAEGDRFVAIPEPE